LQQKQRAEAAGAHERISALDDYDMQIRFRCDFPSEQCRALAGSKQQLDDFAQKVINAKGYMIEISGHTDSTGGDAKNFHLSQHAPSPSFSTWR
jgi:outer membrane protein OmpA-like peptidoglycan-associated protein